MCRRVVQESVRERIAALFELRRQSALTSSCEACVLVFSSASTECNSPIMLSRLFTKVRRLFTSKYLSAASYVVSNLCQENSRVRLRKDKGASGARNRRRFAFPYLSSSQNSSGVSIRLCGTSRVVRKTFVVQQPSCRRIDVPSQD